MGPPEGTAVAVPLLLPLQLTLKPLKLEVLINALKAGGAAKVVL